MPGIHRTGLVSPTPGERLAFALTAGYGYTEPQGGGDSGHHRQLARTAVAAWPLPWFGAGLRLDERYDHHPDDGTGSGPDHGWLFDPTLTARAAFRAGNGVYLGPDLAVWIPASESPGVSLEATTVSARLLASVSRGQLHAGALAGYRLDRSAKTGRDVARMRPGDRLALGLSDFDAWLLGAGASYAFEETLLKGELTADLLWGTGAPSVLESPLRAAAGIEHAIGAALSLEALLEVTLSGRPRIETAAPLVPIEPRITALVGVRYRAAAARPPARSEPSSASPLPTSTGRPPPAKPSAAASPTHVPLDVLFTDDHGQPIVDANLTLEADGQTTPLTHVGQGKYHLDEAPVGKGKLHAEAPGFVALDRTIEVSTIPAPLTLHTQAALPSGQVRGLVRSFRGSPVTANIRIDPGGAETNTDRQGSFQIDVEPGDYEVIIEAPGFTPQRRRVHVQERGVVVLNADLVEAKP